MQKVFVFTKDSSAINGYLFAVENDAHPIFSFPVVVGKCGMGDEKVEGDFKTPLGTFPLLSLFGLADTSPNSKMPYIKIDENLVAVDDPRSRFYNKIVSKAEVAPDWESAEKMDILLYKYGVVVGYNTDKPIPGKGSCIFMHTWQDEFTGTAGCIGMSEENLIKLIGWLDAAKTPHIMHSIINAE